MIYVGSQTKRQQEYRSTVAHWNSVLVVSWITNRRNDYITISRPRKKARYWSFGSQYTISKKSS